MVKLRRAELKDTRHDAPVRVLHQLRTRGISKRAAYKKITSKNRYALQRSMSDYSCYESLSAGDKHVE